MTTKLQHIVALQVSVSETKKPAVASLRAFVFLKI
jgi:hypothetical protein